MANLTGHHCLDALAGLRGARDEPAERRLTDDFALDVRKSVRAYSKGNRQKVILVAASRITAQLAGRQSSTVTSGLRELGLANGNAAGTDLALSVPRTQVLPVLALLARVDAGDITCTPASLEELFLRHYRVAAR